jgi:DNA-directed RNA polymerase alpha subunit
MELPDDTPIGDVELSPRIRKILAAWGLKTVGEVREASDETLLSLPKLGRVLSPSRQRSLAVWLLHLPRRWFG